MGTIGSYFERRGDQRGRPEGRASANDLWAAPQPDISAVQRQVRAADKGFKACVSGAPGTPPQCKALAAMMRAAAANPSLRPAALAQIAELQSATANRIANSYLTDELGRRSSRSSSTRWSPGCGSAA